MDERAVVQTPNQTTNISIDPDPNPDNFNDVEVGDENLDPDDCWSDQEAEKRELTRAAFNSGVNGLRQPTNGDNTANEAPQDGNDQMEDFS